MRNTVLEETQGVIKIAKRSINSLIYAYDTTLTQKLPELLCSLVAVATAMVAQPRAWNGPLSH